jgi:hypothetical protein
MKGAGFIVLVVLGLAADAATFVAMVWLALRVLG